jgi:hypothetical protein
MRKMIVGQFIGNVRGAIGPDALLDAELIDIYNEIRSEGFRYRRDEGDEVFALAAPKLRGILQRRRNRFFNPWASYYFVLTDGCLYYFKDARPATVDTGPLGMIQFMSVSVQPLGADRISVSALQEGDDIQFVKFRKRRPSLVSGTCTVFLRAESQAVRDRWLYRIRTTCLSTSFKADESPQSEGTSGSDITPPPTMPNERLRLGGLLPTMSTPDLPIIMAPNTRPASSLIDDDSSLDKPADAVTPIPSSSSIPELQDVGAVRSRRKLRQAAGGRRVDRGVIIIYPYIG